MHETHAPLMKLPKRNPGELSRMKAEKDAQVLADMQRARQRVEENKGVPRLNGIPVRRVSSPNDTALIVDQIPSGAIPQAGQQTPVQAAQGGQPQPMSQQVVQQLQLLQAQAQANQANRAGNPAPANARVGNIARMSTPGVSGAPRFTSQQMMQIQQRMATGQQSGSTSAVAQVPSGQTPAQYVTRDATASPATHGMNSPHVTSSVAAAGSNTAQLPHNTANSSNAVTQTAQAPAAGMPVPTRAGAQFPLFGANGANLAVANYNAEQLNAMRIHLLVNVLTVSPPAKHSRMASDPAWPASPSHCSASPSD
jgi:chromatin modification-related protein VID21